MVLGVEKGENSLVKIRLEIPKEVFNDGMYKAYLKQRVSLICLDSERAKHLKRLLRIITVSRFSTKMQ